MSGYKILTNVKRWKWLDCEQGRVIGESVDHSWVRLGENGRIDDVGTGDSFPLSATIIDGGGKLLIPGLIDSHIHVAGLGESTYFVHLQDCESIMELKSRVKMHRAKNPTLTWIQGTHWDQSQLGTYPSRFDLDSIEGCEDTPILLWRACWHIAVLNTKAMQLCGILNPSGELCANFTQPEGGVVDVFQENGMTRATGILRERAVEGAVAAMGSKSNDERKRFIREGLHACLQTGLTAVQTNDESCYRVYQEMCDSEVSGQNDDRLPLRVFLTPTVKEIEEDNLGMIHFNNQSHDLASFKSRLTAERVKIFADGSLGAETAAIRKDANTPVGFIEGNMEENENKKAKQTAVSLSKFRGVLIHSTDTLIGKIRRARELGWRVEIHAIGDASAEQVITAMEAGYREASIRAWSPVLTHCQVLGWDLISRMKQANIIANVQPSFVPTDMQWVLDRLSEPHLECSYAWKTLMRQGIIVAGGSDAPIETPNPFIGMYDAIYRESRGDDRQVFRSQECLSFSEALYCYTINAAMCAGDEASKCFGRVEPGYAADLVLVDPEIVENPRLLQSVVPSMVIVGGHVEVDNLSDSSVDRPADRELATNSANLNLPSGPFIPGKNGQMKRGWLHCDCCRVRS